MNKLGVALAFSFILLALLIVGIFLFFVLYESSKDPYASPPSNPAEGLSNELAEYAFDKNSIFYLLYNLEAYKLHNPPLSSDTPKLEINVEGETYNAEVREGLISTGRGSIPDEDVLIITTKAEAIRMMRDKEYARQSFNSGRSSINFIADKNIIFSKGYLVMYNDIVGKSITGNIIRIYLEYS